MAKDSKRPAKKPRKQPDPAAYAPNPVFQKRIDRMMELSGKKTFQDLVDYFMSFGEWALEASFAGGSVGAVTITGDMQYPRMLSLDHAAELGRAARKRVTAPPATDSVVVPFTGKTHRP